LRERQGGIAMNIVHPRDVKFPSCKGGCFFRSLIELECCDLALSCRLSSTPDWDSSVRCIDYHVCDDA